MNMKDWFDVPWNEFFENQKPKTPIQTTGIPLEDIKTICQKISTAPENIKLHNAV